MSICEECYHYRHTNAKIAADPLDSYPAEDWCEEDMANFMTDEGCYKYEYDGRDE